VHRIGPIPVLQSHRSSQPHPTRVRTERWCCQPLATSCQRCRLLATSTLTCATCLPASAHSPCSRCPMRHILSLSVRRRSPFPPLPAIAAKLLPHSALPPTVLLCSKRQNADHQASSSCASEPRQAGHDTEPSSSVGNHRSTEPTAFFFTCRGRLPIECHLRPLTCSSVTAATSTRAHRRSTNPEPTPSTSSPAYHRRFLTTDLLHRCEPATVSPSTTYAPNWDPHLQG
jgi:hypothetical protein